MRNWWGQLQSGAAREDLHSQRQWALEWESAGSGHRQCHKAACWQGWGCCSGCTCFAWATCSHQGSVHTLPMGLLQDYPDRGMWCGVGCPCRVSLCPEGLTSATAWASSCPAWGRGLMGGAPDAHPCLQVQTTTMCISVSLSGTVVLGCLFTPKLHIILFQPQKNVASHRVGTARFSVAAASSSQSHGEHTGAGGQHPFPGGGSVWAPQHGFLKKSGVWGRAKWEMGGNGGCVPSGSSLSCVPMPEDTAPGVGGR